jgi:hypothetical protein
MIKRTTFSKPLVTPLWVSANELHSFSEETKRGDIEMYVSLPPGCHASAVMCEEQSIVTCFKIPHLLCSMVFFFFAVIVNGTLCGFCSKPSMICLFVCLFISAGSEMQICLRFLLEIIMMDVCGMITSQYVFYVRYRFQNNLLLVEVQ